MLSHFLFLHTLHCSIHSRSLESGKLSFSSFHNSKSLSDEAKAEATARGETDIPFGSLKVVISLMPNVAIC